MLRSHRPAAPTSGSAAVARARLQLALRTDRACSVPQLHARALGAPTAAEPPDRVLGRLLDEPVATRREA